MILDILKSLKNVALVAEDNSYLLSLSVLKDNLDLFVYADEFLRLLREFLLHFLGSDKEILEERPKALDLGNDSDNFGDSG